MRHPSPTLLILAAGLGSRYGGLKQFESLGSGGETLLDYSVFDAKRAGFGRAVLVIKPDLDREVVLNLRRRFHDKINIDFVIQDLNDLPDGSHPPAGRTRPWGTLHAVLAARHAIQTPFAVINGDDYYGPQAYRRAVDFFSQPQAAESGKHHYFMVGYRLDHTLSANGGVNRGICVNHNGFLKSVEEHVRIEATDAGLCHGFKLNGQRIDLPGASVASMNFWGFTPAIFDQMQVHFAEFLATRGQALDAECYIPSVVDHLVGKGQADCRILETEDQWFGITYPKDRAHSAAALTSLTQTGLYPSPLWSPVRSASEPFSRGLGSSLTQKS